MRIHVSNGYWEKCFLIENNWSCMIFYKNHIISAIAQESENFIISWYEPRDEELHFQVADVIRDILFHGFMTEK